MQNTRAIGRAGRFPHQAAFGVEGVAQKVSCFMSQIETVRRIAILKNRKIRALNESPVGILYRRTAAAQFPNQENFHLGAGSKRTKQRVELGVISLDGGYLSSRKRVALHRVDCKVNVRLRLPDLVEFFCQRNFIAWIACRSTNRQVLENRKVLEWTFSGRVAHEMIAHRNLLRRQNKESDSIENSASI